MKQTVEELSGIIEPYAERLELMSEEEFSSQPLPEKWSKKEVIGHLIDSAHNNLRRFIVGQYDETAWIVYDQDFWVKANAYQKLDKREIVALWRLLNRRICSVLSEIPPSHYTRQINSGRDSVQLHTLEWLAADYVKHLKHHLNQVYDRAFDIVYP